MDLDKYFGDEMAKYNGICFPLKSSMLLVIRCLIISCLMIKEMATAQGLNVIKAGLMEQQRF